MAQMTDKQYYEMAMDLCRRSGKAHLMNQLTYYVSMYGVEQVIISADFGQYYPDQPDMQRIFERALHYIPVLIAKTSKNN